ncbi:MAG: DUF1517 domain-containing protein [Spirulinaceae cyanobacterium]
MSWRDRLNSFTGKTRIVVSRVMLQLNGSEVAPLLGILNSAARSAVEADGDLEVMGEELANICQSLLQQQINWQSGGNEGDVFWDEGEAGDYVNELFTDSAQRYLSTPDYNEITAGETFSLPATTNLVVMLTIACEGELPDLETNLAANIEAMEDGLKALINLHYQRQLRAVQFHFSPARLGDELTDEQVLLNFPELVPL